MYLILISIIIKYNLEYKNDNRQVFNPIFDEGYFKNFKMKAIKSGMTLENKILELMIIIHYYRILLFNKLPSEPLEI